MLCIDTFIISASGDVRYTKSGKESNILYRVSLPDDKVSQQVTGEFDDGQTMIFDDIVTNKKTGKVKLANETKTGKARLSDGQKRFFDDGDSVKLKGKNAGTASGQKINKNNTKTRITRIPREDLDND